MLGCFAPTTQHLDARWILSSGPCVVLTAKATRRKLLTSGLPTGEMRPVDGANVWIVVSGLPLTKELKHWIY